MTRTGIAEYALAEFGAAARFHTCDVGELSFDALFELLVARGKLVADGALWSTVTAKVCADE